MEYTPVASDASTCRIRRLQSVIDQTASRYIEEQRREDFEKQYPYIDPSSADNQGSPLVWFQSGYTTSRDVEFKLYPVPDSARTLSVTFTEEPLPLVDDADVPRVPDQYHYGLSYAGMAKYYEFMKDPIAAYYRRMWEEFKMKVLSIEFGDTDEMPAMQPMVPGRPVIMGKIGRIYN